MERMQPQSIWVQRLHSPLAGYYAILGSAVALGFIGLIMVLSGSSVEALNQTGNSFSQFSKQALFAALGLPLGWLAMRLPAAWWQRVAWPLLGISSVLLLLVAVMGTSRGGNRNWIAFAGVQIQPSEGVKLALVVWCAAVVARKYQLGLTRTEHVVIPIVPGALLLMGMVMLGNDLGTAVIMMLIVASVLLYAGVPRRVLTLGFLAVSTLGMLLVISSPHRMDRFNIWSGKKCDYLQECWQTTQGLWGLATGGWWGVGLGRSREKWMWLPEAHNDFIFAIIGEELGLVGAMVVIILCALLGWGLITVAANSRDVFSRVVTGAILWWVVGQALINIGSVIGLLPVVGVPLPLVSSGGSALMTTMVAIGLALGCARRVPGASEALAERTHVVRRTFSVLPARARLRNRATVRSRVAR